MLIKLLRVRRKELPRRIISGIMLTLLLGSMLFSAITLVEGEMETHDLDVSLTAPIIRNTYNHLPNGTSTVLNVTVVNNGNDTEDNVNLQLLINESIALNSTAFRLSPNGTFWTAYMWAPLDGVYNLTAYVPPVTGESPPYDANNIVTKWVNVSIDEAPYVNFTYSPLSPPPDPHPVENELVTFNASYPVSYDPDWGTILNYTWDLGDGNITTVNHTIITHKYTEYGEYNVTLTVEDTENLSSNETKSIRVYSPPIASFTISGYRYVDYPLTFDASASRDPDNDIGPTSGIANYTWDFGDGSPLFVTNETITTHTYTTNRTYVVNLTVTDYDNLNGSWNRNITIGPGIPTADFEIIQQPPYYVNQTLTFDASNSLPNGEPIVNYTWTFSEGENGTDMIVHHTFRKARIYNVTLTVTDEKGLTDSISRNVTVVRRVYVKVEEYGNTTIVHNPKEPAFDVNITISNVEDLFDFEFKLNWPPTWLPPEYRLLDYISVKEGDFLGDLHDQEGRVRYNFRPYPDEGEGYMLINCTFKTYVPKEERSGNGTLAIIEFQVLSPGNCTLSLSSTKLINSTEGEIVHTPINGSFYTATPVANFTCSKPAVPHQNVTFYASSSYDPDNYTARNHGIANYTWNFDDGTTPVTTSNPTINYTFTDFGTYNVNLTVTDYNKTTWWIQYPVLVGSRNVTITAVDPCTFAFNETLGGYETNGYLPINVAVKNNGDFKEEFNVTVYADNEVLGTQTFTLEPDQSKNLTYHLYAFLWNETHGLPKGNYTISANATSPPVKTNMTGGWVIVGLTGDVNGDHICDGQDFQIVKNHIGTTPTSPNWNPNADLNEDGVVDGQDFQIVKNHIGTWDP